MAEVAAWAAVFVGVAAGVHFGLVSVPWDTDTAYHVAVGRLLREHGLLRAFPWTPFSWLADHYADKELLFHLGLAGLSGLDWITAAKVAGTVSGALMLLALHLVLRAERVAWAGLWALLPLGASSVFLFRFALVRPHVLSIGLAALVLWAASRERLGVLAAASFVYPWAYVALPMPPVLAVIAEVARGASGRRPGWRVPAVALCGVVAGVALHPNGLDVVRLSWIHLWDVLLEGAWGGRPDLELGREFDPFTLGQWASWLLGATAMAGAALALAWRGRRERPAALGFALAALGFGLLTARTARFAEYFVPFSTAALALALGPLAGRRRLLPVGIAAALLLYAGGPLLETAQGLGARPDRLPAPIAERLRQTIPPGAQVFTCDWGHTGDLLLALPDRKFMVALDPTLFWLKDPERYRRWFALPRGASEHPAREIREVFGARYVVCLWEDRFRRFFDRLAFEPGVRTLVLTEDWNAYELGDP